MENIDDRPDLVTIKFPDLEKNSKSKKPKSSDDEWGGDDTVAAKRASNEQSASIKSIKKTDSEKKAPCWNYFETKFSVKHNKMYDFCLVKLPNGLTCNQAYVHNGTTKNHNRHLHSKANN